MKKAIFTLAACSTLLVGCQNNAATEKKPEAVASTPAATAAAPAKPTIDTLCFELKLKKDITSCQLFIEGDKVTGYYDWAPYQKDGGHGILQNGVKKGDMITVDWKMMIEGNVQAEELMLKLEADKLIKMGGELTEKGDTLVIKAPDKAKAGDVLTKVNCTQIAHGIENAKSVEDVIRKTK
jgi:hypothetical protein